MDMWATAWHMTNHSLSSRQAAASKCPSNRQLLAASILNPLSFSVCFSGGLRIGTARKLTSKTSELLSAESQDKHIFFLYWNDMSWDSRYSRYKFIWAITWMDNGFPTFKPRTFFLLIGLNVETVKRIHPWAPIARLYIMTSKRYRCSGSTVCSCSYLSITVDPLVRFLEAVTNWREHECMVL